MVVVKAFGHGNIWTGIECGVTLYYRSFVRFSILIKWPSIFMIVALNRMSDLTKTAFCQSSIMTVKIISVPLPKTLKDMKKIPFG